MIREAVRQSCFRYGWEGAYMAAKEGGYSRSYSGFIYAAKRLGLCGGKQEKPNIRKSDRRYSEILVLGGKVQVDVKEVPYNCLKGAARRDGKHYREEKKTVLMLLEKLFGRHAEIVMRYRAYITPARTHIHEEKGPSVPSYRRRVW